MLECVVFFPVKGSAVFSMHLFPFSVISHGRGPRPLLCFDPLNGKRICMTLDKNIIFSVAGQ